MAYINLDSPLNIVLVSVCVLAVLYLIYRMFFSTPTTTPIITPQMTTAYNAAAVNQGLTAADVRSPQENFEATSGSNLNVFDTRQKLNQNLDLLGTKIFESTVANKFNKSRKLLSEPLVNKISLLVSL